MRGRRVAATADPESAAVADPSARAAARRAARAAGRRRRRAPCGRRRGSRTSAPAPRSSTASARRPSVPAIASRRRRATTSNGSPRAQRRVAAGVAEAQAGVQHGRDARRAGAQRKLEVLGEQVHGRVERPEPPQRGCGGGQAGGDRPADRAGAVGPVRLGTLAQPRAAAAAGAPAPAAACPACRGAGAPSAGPCRRRSAAAARGVRSGCRRASAARTTSDASSSSQSGFSSTVTSCRAHSMPALFAAPKPGLPASATTSAPCSAARSGPPSRDPLSTTTSCGGSGRWASIERSSTRSSGSESCSTMTAVNVTRPPPPRNTASSPPAVAAQVRGAQRVGAVRGKPPPQRLVARELAHRGGERDRVSGRDEARARARRLAQRRDVGDDRGRAVRVALERRIAVALEPRGQDDGQRARRTAPPSRCGRRDPGDGRSGRSAALPAGRRRP